MSILRKSHVVLLAAILQVSILYTSAARVKGRFDRFGSDKNLLNADNLRSSDAVEWYHHPDVRADFCICFYCCYEFLLI